MSSDARTDFLEALEALEAACDASNVREQTSTGKYLRKGLVVAAFNTLEGFVAARWEELARFVNSGYLQFQDLPDPMQLWVLEHTLDVAHGDLSRSSFTLSETRDFAFALGSSLSAVTGGLRLSGFAGKWKGSNLHAGDLAEVLRRFHVDSPWATIRDTTSLFGYSAFDGAGKQLDLNQEFLQLSRTRNEAAHQVGFNISTLQLRTVPTFIRRVGLGFDILASVAACRLQAADQAYLANPRNVSVASLSYLSVVQRSRDFAAFRPGRSRALARGADGSLLFNSVCTSATTEEVVVRMDQTQNVVDWMVAGPG